ncbi:hypothetical protein ZWY2020_015509 [Hordeum vulgare]|nr:hypothetical protein ZWY2020_015509 [Hordeum vulgare]
MARRHLRTPLLPLLSRAPTPIHLRHALCSSTAAPTIDAPPPAASPAETPEDAPARTAPEAPEAGEQAPARATREEEPLHETILHMIRRRKWTTRMENSVRLLCPALTAPVVHGVISAAAAANRADLSLQFFRFAYRRAGFRPEPATFALLVPILASKGMLNHTRCILLDTMPSFSVCPDEATVAALVAAYGRAGIPQEAVKLFRLMPELGITRTALSYNAVLKAILCRGREAMARRVYNAMITDGVAPTLSTYNTLIWGFGLCKKMESAVRVFGDMKGHGWRRMTTYNTLLNAWVRKGDLESARKVFDEMPEAGLERNSISYNVMIKGYVDANKVEEALGLFTEMGEKGLRLTEKTFLKKNEPADAKTALDSMMEHGHLLRPALFQSVMAALFNDGRVQTASRVMKSMIEKGITENMDMANKIVEALFMRGHVEEAIGRPI